MKLSIDDQLLLPIEKAQEFFNKKGLDLDFQATVTLLLFIATSEDVYKVYGTLYEKTE
tara:strand:+ start:412 stop:585 length:174 start_codon:yes stop_codon:yes gene_type:complete